MRPSPLLPVSGMCVFLALLLVGCGSSGGGGSSNVSSGPPAPTVSITLSQSTVPESQEVTLTWSSTNATSCTASGAWSGSEQTSGSQMVSQTSPGTYTYTLTCSGSGGSTNNSATLTVPNPPTVTISVSPNPITFGSSASLTWTTTGATSCTASGAWTGTQGTSGTQNVTPTSTGTFTYVLTCQNSVGTTAIGNAALIVNPQSIPTAELTANGSHSLTVGAGSTILYNWSSSNAGSAVSNFTVDGGQPSPWVVTTLSGSTSETIAASQAGHTYVFSYTVTNPTGQAATDQVTIVVTGSAVASTRDQAQYTQLYSDNVEGMPPATGPGLQLLNGATVTTDPTLVIAGQGSILLNNYGTVATNPTVLTLSGNATYVVEFAYHIVNPGSDTRVLYLWMQPTGTDVVTSPQLQITLGSPLENAAATGTFSAGAETASAATYQLNISATADSTVVIDNIFVYRKDVVQSVSIPPSWSALDEIPFPRLGKYGLGAPETDSQFPGAEPPFTFTVDQIESRYALMDVIIGFDVANQTQFVDSIRRIRLLNPQAVILPYRISEEQQVNLPPPFFSNLDPKYDFLQGIADVWYVRDTKGNYVPDPTYPSSRKMNISPFAPVVNGHTFLTYERDWLLDTVFPSGVWDGIFFDNLFGQINPHILNYNNPALLDYDWNRNGVRDETPALSSEMTRTAASGFLQDLQTNTGGSQLVVGNNGPFPELHLAPFVNGYSFECVNYNWNAPFFTSLSPAGWRALFDAYRTMQTIVRTPRINVLEGCGQQYSVTPGQAYVTPTAADIQSERFTLATALLSDGFYSYDVHGSLSAPFWFDEYSVDASGTADESAASKGYLGQALSDATELTAPGSLLMQEGFENGVVPASFVPNPPSAVSVSQTPSDVISGKGSLVISNPDHTQQGYVSANTNPNVVPLTASTTYLLVFDWRILQTLDATFSVDVFNSNPSLDVYYVPGVVAGDSGTAYFPFTIPMTGNWTIRFAITNGGGEVAIDNVRLYQGGVGPWRRDFENGFVLVNPFSQPHTFSAADVIGSLQRTNIRRIKGTQDPVTNSGQAVTGSITLGPFDAVILLADRIQAPPTVVRATATPLYSQVARSTIMALGEPRH